MKYSLKSLYREYGQFSQTVNVTLKPGSESFIKYGSDLTGEFAYSNEQRKHYQSQLDSEDENETHGKVRFKFLLSDISRERKYDLYFDGINSADVKSVFAIPFSNNNDYTQQEVRRLPEPTIIRFNARNFDEIKAMIGLFQHLSENGPLPKFEQAQYVAYRIIQNGYKVSEDIIDTEFYDNEAARLSEKIEFLILKYKYDHKELNADEDERFKELLKASAEEAGQILFAELDRGNYGKKYSASEYKEILKYLPSIVATFQEERLTYTKVAVWWNLERFLHIFLRHVSVLQIGEYFKGKTPFQYELPDIKDLIKNVLQELSEQINIHFDKTPDRDFSIRGSMSHDYNGDYYAVHIRTDGLLMAFYKNS